LREIAPGVGLTVLPIDASTARALESGETDLALGFVAGLESGFHEQSLYSQDFVCLVNGRHPRVRDEFTLRDFRDEAHVAVLSSTSYPMVNTAMKRQRIDRRVALELPGFLGLAAIVSSTDLIATVPRTIGEALARTGTIRVMACPVRLPTFSVKQYWHARYHHDHGNRWLRAQCAALFAQPMRYQRSR
jgi:DNA-binding transcriptional LysR family regulator